MVQQKHDLTMGNGEMGENSKRTPRTPDEDDERPFKKARYVWQLKGKYHLKQSVPSTNTISVSEEMAPRVHISDSDSDSDANINNNICGSNYCKDRCCIDDMLVRSDALLDEVDSDDTNDIEKAISDEIPITLVKSNRSQDDYLHKWQARQVVKSFVDNTINSILELWKIAPVDAAELLENCRNDGQVEDEGILMAIQSHGLHSGLRYREPIPNLHGEPSSFPIDNEEVAATLAATDNIQNLNTERLKDDDASSESSDMGNEMDFLNAAVSAAIKKRGLSSI